MLSRFLAALTGAVAIGFGFGGAANAATLVPATGSDFGFTWNDPSGPPAIAPEEFEITLSEDSLISVALEDGLAVGDVFTLLLNGVSLDIATERGNTSDGSFTTNPLNDDGLVGGRHNYGIWNNLLLTAGTHTFGVQVDDYAPGFTFGTAARIYFSETVAVAESVPEPTSGFTILAVGSIALGQGLKKKFLS